MLHHRITAPRQRAEQPHCELFKMPTRLFQQDGKVNCGAARAAIFDRNSQAKPAVFCERFVCLPRRTRFVVATLGIFWGTHIIQQVVEVATQRFLTWAKRKIHL
jgi:hypothetical protein